MTLVRGDTRTGTVSTVTNVVGDSATFDKPVDNIGVKAIPNYAAYAACAAKEPLMYIKPSLCVGHVVVFVDVFVDVAGGCRRSATRPTRYRCFDRYLAARAALPACWCMAAGTGVHQAVDAENDGCLRLRPGTPRKLPACPGSKKPFSQAWVPWRCCWQLRPARPWPR